MSTMLMLNNSLEILMVQSSNLFNPIYCSFLLADTFHHHVGKEQTHFEFETQKVSSACCSTQLRLEAPGHVVYWRSGSSKLKCFFSSDCLEAFVGTFTLIGLLLSHPSAQ